MILLQAVAADLFFALDQELQVQRQPALDRDPGLGALQVGEHLALVVGGAAGVEVAVAAGRLERGGDPLFQRIGRLHVVMAVDQGRRGTGHGRRLGIDQRMPGRGDHLGGEPHAAELVGHPVGRPVHVVPVVRIGADAGNPQKLAQFLLEPCGVGIQILVDGGHGRLPVSGWIRQRPFTADVELPIGQRTDSVGLATIGRSASHVRWNRQFPI